MKGRYQWNKRTAEGFDKAIELFNQAIEEDPTYALAYVGLSDCYAVLGEYGVLPSKDSIPKAKAAVIKALEIDDHIAEAHAALGNIKMTYEWDWEGEWLDRAYEERDAWLTGIKVDPMLDALRPDPRFTELEQRLNLAL